MGWYMMALVDVLDSYPEGDRGKKQLIAYLVRDAAAVAKVQDTSSGLWYQVLDKAGAKGNYLESSASCMFVYASPCSASRVLPLPLIPASMSRILFPNHSQLP